MTKEEAFIEINKIQDEYVNDLLGLINSPDYTMMKTIDFTSATGTGKTKMMSKLINLLPDCYFIVTTLSKGQLHLQVREELAKDCAQDNYYVYGSADYKINSKLDAEDIIGKIPENTKCIWLRDEGHIKTNRYDELLQNVCYKVINFSATNPHSDIQCNFTQTMMLRTVNQTSGTPKDAIQRLMEIKKAHKDINNYNPCAIFRCISGDEKLHEEIVALCKKNKLKYIDINDDPYVMAELCEDDNENDVIINKFKIVEGIDIRRAHVLYMDNQPGNNATTIQAIGRCRRNALLYRDDIDILSPDNAELLKQTRECYVYYNVKNMRIDTDQDGELQYAFCNHISCEALKSGTTIEVTNGQLANGLYVLELAGQTGQFAIRTDESTGFNIVDPITEFYATKKKDYVNQQNYVYLNNYLIKGKVHIKDVPMFPMTLDSKIVDDPTVHWPRKNHHPYYDLDKALYCHREFRFISIAMCGNYHKEFNIPKNFDKRDGSQANKLTEQFLSRAFDYTKDYIRGKLIEENDVINQINLPTVLVYIDFAYTFFIKEHIYVWNWHNKLSFRSTYRRCSECIDDGFKTLDTLLKLLYVPKDASDEYAEIIYTAFNNLVNNVSERKLVDSHYDYERLIKPLTADEKALIDAKQLITYSVGYYRNKLLTRKVIHEYPVQVDYRRTLNDKHSATIGTDSMKQIRLENGSSWIEARAITSKIGTYSKLDRFISNQYATELERARSECFNGKNSFTLDKRCNTIIGYCVEYYSKYLLYGNDFLYPYIDKALEEARKKNPTKEIIIRACMLKYKAMMSLSFGKETAKLIQGITTEQLLTDKHKEFVSLVIKLGKRTADYVKATLYPDGKPVNDTDPNLSVLHIAGLADYITPDTILDVKVRNNIDEKCVRQVLAYHYLSTKRSDLNIKRVIVYDASSDRAVVIPIEPCNQISSKGNKKDGKSKKGWAVL